MRLCRVVAVSRLWICVRGLEEELWTCFRATVSGSRALGRAAVVAHVDVLAAGIRESLAELEPVEVCATNG